MCAYRITAIKSANLRSHLSSLLTYEKTISCKYVNYFLIPGKPALLYVHYNTAIGLNYQPICKASSEENGTGQYPVCMIQKPRKGEFRELKSKNFEGGSMPPGPLEICAFGTSLANRSVFILHPRL